MFDPVNLLNISVDNQPMGRMVLSPSKVCVFEYDPDYLKNGLSLSPFYLPLQAGAFTSRIEPFYGLFGLFNDSLPDDWGNLLVDRYLVSEGISPKSLSVLDRLSIVGKSGMGILTYKPECKLASHQQIDDLNLLASEVRKILLEADYKSGILNELMAMGGSSGGARPKAMINIDGEPWIVKFRSSQDVENIGEVEYQYSVIAKKCGIEMPETRLLENQYFAVKRFDRNGSERIHIHSASGLLYADHRIPSLDYMDLIKATFALTKDINESYKLFRLMVFNFLTGNMDDHAKNFSFILKDKQWYLSPAYDLVPCVGYNGNHSTTILGKGTAERKDILEVAKLCNLESKLAENIYNEVYENCEDIRVI